jgi:hypothetical protein
LHEGGLFMQLLHEIGQLMQLLHEGGPSCNYCMS